MPYKKRTYKKKRYNRKSKRSMVKTIARVVRQINPPEHKYTVGNFFTNITDVANIYELVNWPIQGTEGYADDQNLTDTNGASRIGNQITVKNIQWKWTISIGDSLNYVRVILIQFMDNNILAGPLAGDIIADINNLPWIQPLNPLNRQRIRVLYDKTFNLQSGGVETITRTINVRPPLKTIRFTSNATAAYPAEIIKGKLYYLLVSDSSAIPHPKWQNTTRLCFTDA